jgi:PAS domain S-box-containing protein
MDYKTRILIVEDESIVAIDLKKTLENSGYEIAGIVHSGELAVKKAVEIVPDLILMDIMLEGKLTGIEAALEIGKKKDIPVVYLTAYANESTLSQAKLTQPFGYILKPFDEKNLVSTIEMAVYKHKLDLRLKENEERYRKLVENSPVAIAILTGRHIVYANPYAVKMLGAASEEELKSRYVFDFISSEFAVRVKETIQKIMKEGKVVEVSNEKLNTLDGKKLDVELTAIPVYYLDKPAIQVVMRDVTELNKKEEAREHYTEKLKKMNETKDKFLSLISHDLKSPFNSMMGYSEILKNEIDDLSKEERDIFIGSIYESTRHIYNLLNDLLEFSRFYLGMIKIEPGKIHIRKLVDDNIEFLSNTAKQKGISLKNCINNDYIVLAEEDMLNSIFRNLITNSIKFTDRGGKVEIYAEPDQDHLNISVSDNGIGMDKKTMEILFDIVSKKSKPGTNEEEGTGLGLILTKEFVEKNGGEIFVESEPAKGTTFTFTLPFSEKNISA